MKGNVLRLPWAGKYVPHVILDIIRGCNIRCGACYNNAPASRKTLPEILSELEFAAGVRNLSSVSVIGGEPLLHPQLCDVIRAIRQKGFSATLCTNGVLFDGKAAEALSDAGLNMMFIHCERNQVRPDLPAQASLMDVENLCRQKAELAAAHGIDVGLSITTTGENVQETVELVRLVLESPHIHYMLMTMHRVQSGIRRVSGDIFRGMHAERFDGSSIDSCSRFTIPVLEEQLRSQLSLSPFAYMGSNIDESEVRWLSYLVGCVTGAEGQFAHATLKASLLERMLMGGARLLTGRYPMYLPQNEKIFRVQLLLNAILGGRPSGNLRLLRRSLAKGASIKAKRLLLQDPAEVMPDGVVKHCRHCPDAIPKQGRLVPVCICDLVDNAEVR